MTYPHGDPDESHPVQEGRSLWQPDADAADLQIALEHFEHGLRAMQALVGPRKPSDIRERTPAFDRYPVSRLEISVQHGVDLLDQQVGFSARAIVVQNINATGFIRLNDQLLFVPPRTQLALFNIPQGFEKFSVQWYTNQTTPGVTPVAGTYATVWLFDEWVPPSVVNSTGVAIVDANGAALFPAAAAKTDNMENVPVTEIGARLEIFDGSTWDRWRSALLPVGSALVAPTAQPTNGLTPFKLISLGSTNANVVKATPGNLYNIIVTNLNAAARYLKLYDKATAPTVGTDVPVWTILIPGTATAGVGAGIVIPVDLGLGFANGIGIALTTGVATADTGAVAANEIVVNLGYS